MVKDKILISGKKLLLRKLSREHLSSTYLNWLNDEEVTYYLETGSVKSTMEDLELYFQRVTESEHILPIAIESIIDGKHIGNLKLEPISYIHKKATLGVLIGDKNYWGKGVGFEALNLVLKYSFNRLKLKRINLGVFDEHVAAIRLYKKVGFKEEGLFRNASYHHPSKSFKNQMWLGILDKEFNYKETQ